MICRHLTKTGLASNKFVEQSDKTVRLWPDMSGIIRVIWALFGHYWSNVRAMVDQLSDLHPTPPNIWGFGQILQVIVIRGGVGGHRALWDAGLTLRDLLAFF